MRRFTQDWIKFFRNCNINSDKLEQVYTFLSQFTSNILLKPSDLSAKIELSNSELIEVINELQKLDIVSINNSCPFCSNELFFSEYTIVTCPGCESEVNVKEINSLNLKKDITQENYLKKKISEETYEFNAKMLFNSGISEGYLYYAITDIENSQAIQDENPDDYLKILDWLWNNVWIDVFRQSQSAYLPVLARGDAVSVVYASPDDAVNTIYRIAEQNIDIKISLFIGKIIFKKKDRSAFMRSLDGKWDLNLASVTDLYRISDEIKPSAWMNQNNYHVKYAIIDDMIESALKLLKSEYKKESFIFHDKHHKEYKVAAITGIY